MVDRIKQLCKDQGKTIFSLEQECGFGNGTIHKWDRNAPSITKVIAVAHALEVSLYDLLDEEQKKLLTIPDEELSVEDRRLLKLMKKLSVDQKQFLLAQLLTLTGQGKYTPVSAQCSAAEIEAGFAYRGPT